MRQGNPILHVFSPKILVLFVSLGLIAVMAGLAGCGSDDDPVDPVVDNEDPPLISEEADFTGDLGVVLEVADSKVEILPGTVSGDWTLTVAIGDQADHDEAGNIELAGPVVAVELAPTAPPPGETLPQMVKGPIMIVTIPLDEGDEFTENITGVMTAATAEAGQHMVAFLDPVYLPLTHEVELTVDAIDEGITWVIEHAADGIEFYLASFPSDCVTETDPQLVPFDSSALGDRQALILVHGFTVFDLCEADPEVLQLRTLANDLIADEDISGSFKVYEYEYPVSRALAESGQDLANILQATFDPSTEIAIVAYSMGGLVARSAMEAHGAGAQVTELITIGTPHTGTILANSQDVLNELKLKFSGFPRHWASRQDLMIGSTFLTEMNALLVDRSDYLTIAGVATRDWYAVPLRLRMICQLSTAVDGDLVVARTSALLAEKAQVTFTGLAYNHVSLPELSDVRNLVLDRLRPEIPQEGDLVPLAVGNWWSFLFNDGTTHKLGISGSEWVDVAGLDVLAYHWNWFDGDVPSEYYWLVMNDEQGFWTLASHSPGVEDVIDPQLWLKYPVSVGEQWVHLGKTVTCLDTSSSVLVPAGTFSCINYQFEYSLKADLPQPGQVSSVSSPWFPPYLQGDAMLKASYTLSESPGTGNVRVIGDRGYTLMEFFLVE